MIPQNFRDLPSARRICGETEREGERMIGPQRRVRPFIFGTYAAQVLALMAKGFQIFLPYSSRLLGSFRPMFLALSLPPCRYQLSIIFSRDAFFGSNRACKQKHAWRILVEEYGKEKHYIIHFKNKN